jgi:hypothetical protein
VVTSPRCLGLNLCVSCADVRDPALVDVAVENGHFIAKHFMDWGESILRQKVHTALSRPHVSESLQ